MAAAQEPSPLRLLPIERGEDRRQRKGRLHRKGRPTASEGGLERAGEVVGSEAEGEGVDVEEVAQAAVPAPQHDHRVDLLRDRCLGPVGPQARSGEIEERGVVDPGWRGYDVVADPYIDLEVQAGGSQVGDQGDSLASVLVLDADGSDTDRGGVEGEAVRLDR